MDDPITELKQWFFKQPKITRSYLLGSFILAATCSLGLISPFSLYHSYDTTFKNFQIWRLITSILFQGKFSFNFLFAMFFAYFGIARVQVEIFNKQTYADFLWLIICLSGSLLFIGTFIDLYFLGDPFIFALIYIWCKRRPFEIVNFFFGLQVKSGYFPWVLIAFRVLMGANLIVYGVGLLLGHLYITIKDIFTTKYHKDYLPTPLFFKRWINAQPRQQRQFRPRQVPRGPFVGAGVRIG